MRKIVGLILFGLFFPVSVLVAQECQKIEVLKLRNPLSSETSSLWKLQGTEQTAFFFRSGMTIDADGAPRAYHPVSANGLGALGNAGKPGNWWALVTANGKSTGKPMIQKETDPAPGFYISTTALEDTTKRRTDPRRYVDSSTIPYVVLPPDVMKMLKAKMGDFAVVIKSETRRLSHTIVADQGPKGEIGEGSIALAEALSILSNPRSGGTSDGVLYLVFPGSGNRKPRSLEEINTEAKRLFESWGGMARVNACFP